MIGIIIILLGTWAFFGFHAALVTAFILACAAGVLTFIGMSPGGE